MTSQYRNVILKISSYSGTSPEKALLSSLYSPFMASWALRWTRLQNSTTTDPQESDEPTSHSSEDESDDYHLTVLNSKLKSHVAHWLAGA